MKKAILYALVFLSLLVTVSIVYYYIFYPYSYGPNKAAQNGDITTGTTFINSDKFYQFVQNVDNKQSDNIRIVAYSKEGEPSIKDLDYDGTLIHYTEDSTRKRLGNHRYKVSGDYTNISITTNSNGINDYFLVDERGIYNKVWIYQD